MRSAGPASRLRLSPLLALLVLAGAPACRERQRQVVHLPAPSSELEWLAAASETRPGIWLGSGDAIEWSVPAGGARRLSGSYESSLSGAESGSLVVSLTSLDSKTSKPSWRTELSLAHAPGRWRGWSVELPRREQAARLSVSFRGSRGGSPVRSVFLATTSLESVVKGRPRTIVLFLIDTLRADRVTAYGYGRATTPRVDAYFRQGLRAETCLPAGNWTLPSHASLLTSTSVARHGVGRYGHVLPQGLETLAGSLAASGYRTLAVTGGGYVDPSFGFARGFDRYAVLPGRAALAVESALSMLEQHRGEPVFLFLHTYQVHDYAPDEAAARRLFSDLSVLGPDWQASIGVLSRTRMRDPGLSGWVSARYDAALLSVDDAFGKLLEGLESQGRLAETGVLLTSDHGEALCDRKLSGNCLEWGHGSPYLFEEELLVPLLARFPWRQTAPRVIPGTSTLLDVAPTLADAAGVRSPPSFEGRSLLSTGVRSGRAAATEAPPHDAVAMHDAKSKIIRRTGTAQVSLFDPKAHYYRMPVQECFDLANDPGEVRPVACDGPSGDGPSGDELPARLDRYLASGFPGSLVLRVPGRSSGGGPRQARIRARGRGAAPGIRTFGLAAPAELSQQGAVTEARFWTGLAPVWIGIEPLDGSQALELELEGVAPLVDPAGGGLGPGNYRWPDLVWTSGRALPGGAALFTTAPAPRLTSAAPALTDDVAARLMSLGYLRGAPALSGKLEPSAAAGMAGAELASGQLRILRAD